MITGVSSPWNSITYTHAQSRSTNEFLILQETLTENVLKNWYFWRKNIVSTFSRTTVAIYLLWKHSKWAAIKAVGKFIFVYQRPLSMPKYLKARFRFVRMCKRESLCNNPLIFYKFLLLSLSCSLTHFSNLRM